MSQTINTRNPLDPRTLENSWQLPVLASQNTPPANPVNGARYRITATATGAWAGKENSVAIWNESQNQWVYETYVEGTVLYDFGANDYRYVKNDGTWEQFDKIPLAISDVTGLQAALDAKASTSHQSTHQSGQSDALTGNIDAIAKHNVNKQGSAAFSNRQLEFADGANISIAVSENSGKTIVTITSTGSVITEFADNLFRILGSSDNTKKVAIEVDTNVPTSSTVTLIAPAAGGTIPTLENNAVFSALVQALTMVATNSITSAKLVLTDLAADPTVNGEIQRNGNIIKAKSNGVTGKILIGDADNETITIDGQELSLKAAFLL